MEKQSFICIGCPMGCELTATRNDKDDVSVEGGSCKIGEQYGREEMLHPARNVTTSVEVINGAEKMLSVKTLRPVPKDKIMECVAAIKALRVEAPVRTGDVLTEDIAGTGVAVVATRDVDVQTESIKKHEPDR